MDEAKIVLILAPRVLDLRESPYVFGPLLWTRSEVALDQFALKK